MIFKNYWKKHKATEWYNDKLKTNIRVRKSMDDDENYKSNRLIYNYFETKEKAIEAAKKYMRTH